jgi:hypothetical protein
MAEYVDISEHLRDQRAGYVRLRDHAERFSNAYPNSEVGNAMAEQCRLLDAAIASIDTALKN